MKKYTFDQAKAIIENAKNFYEALDLDQKATPREIKVAYRSMAIAVHPDQNPTRLAKANELFQTINNANETLSNPADRANYDDGLKQEATQDSGSSIIASFKSAVSNFCKAVSNLASSFKNLFTNSGPD